LKKFTPLGKPYQANMFTTSWYVPAVKLPSYYFLTTERTVEDYKKTTFGFSFSTYEKAIAAAECYYADHGGVYPYASLENPDEAVKELFNVVESEVMKF
jgi:hypothetical protein